MKYSTTITHLGSIKFINGNHAGMSFYHSFCIIDERKFWKEFPQPELFYKITGLYY
jgi:hypothetical protein